jgi:hypothetical protein
MSDQKQIPETIAAMTPDQILRWLDSQQAVALLTSKARSRIRRALRAGATTHAQLLAHQVEVAYADLLSWAASDYWADLVMSELQRAGLFAVTLRDNQGNAARLQIYPLRVTRVMRTRFEEITCEIPADRVCRVCERRTPRPYMTSRGACVDCQEASVAESARRMGRRNEGRDVRALRGDGLIEVW